MLADFFLSAFVAIFVFMPFVNRKLLFVFLLHFFIIGNAQHETGLIFNKSGSQDGYVLFAPLHSKTTYLIDKCGKVVHTWQSRYTPAQSVYLLPNGELLRTANDSNKAFKSSGGLIERFDWNNRLKWSYKISTPTECQHHDICPLPNGNILVLVWEKKTKAEALEAGRDPDLLGESVWNEKIIELEPRGKNEASIVWQWNLWDHLIQDYDSTKKNFGKVSAHPEKVNLNYYRFDDPDWFHFNSLDYNAERDQILVSNRNYSEMFILDHSANTAQATTHEGGRSEKGGDLLYRFGNKRTSNNGGESDQVLFGQHYPHWIKNGLKNEGKIIVFNNGFGMKRDKQSCVDIIAPINKGTNSYYYDSATVTRFYSEKEKEESGGTFFSLNVSSAQQLSNGNILVCSGSTGRFCELNENKETVWLYINPASRNGILKRKKEPEQNQVFRCNLYSPDYPAFKKKKLIGGNPIELESSYSCVK